MEKNEYDLEEPQYKSHYHPDGRRGSVLPNDQNLKLGEAADLYGDIQSAEHYGYVQRG